MAPFYPLYVRRSDGKLEVKTGKTSTERNEPSTEQLDIKPNTQGISDFYRECKFGDQKETDWRRKLAGMLMRELGGHETRDRNYILAALPENYRVFEHIKCKLDPDGQPQKMTKNHAAGGNERQDAYLYGHPMGRKKRYRSPAEFFPHLMWLATDEKGDPDNCSCKFCSPEELEASKEPAKTSTEKHKSATLALAQNGQTNASTPSTVIQPTPLPRFRSQEQKLDSKFNEFWYRPGEVVWFARESAWGLAVVLRREAMTSEREKHPYRIQPLSHPLKHSAPLVRGQPLLRPWLAWSPPPCTAKGLNPSPSNNHRVYTFDTVDWQGVLNGHYGAGGDAEVDGSILAAKAVETTFTLFEPIPAEPGSSLIEYVGIFLGGEKIWVGEPVRLRDSTTQTNIMIVQSIIEQTNSRESTSSTIFIKGDTYAYQNLLYTSGTVLPEDLHLPLRMREDLKLRNDQTTQHVNPEKRYYGSYQLLSKGAAVRLEDIKGRWYESSLLLPIMNPEYAKNCRANGQSDEVGFLLNSHGSCNRDVGSNVLAARAYKPATIKMSRREDAFGQSIPASTRISAGLDEARRLSSGGVPASRPDSQRQPSQQTQAASEQVDRAQQPPSRSTPQQQQQQQQVHTQQNQAQRQPQPLQTQQQQSHATVPQHQQHQQPYPAQQQQRYTQQSQQPQAQSSQPQTGQPYAEISQLPGASFDHYMAYGDSHSGHSEGNTLPDYGQEYHSHDLDNMFGQHDSMQP